MRQTLAVCRNCWVAVFLLVVPGCGQSDGSARLPVFGKLNGGEAGTLSGSISFMPAKGHSGLGGTCALENGSYKFDKANGPTAGPHDVIIRRRITKPIDGPRSSGPRPQEEWNLTAEVPTDGPYQIDFKLD